MSDRECVQDLFLEVWKDIVKQAGKKRVKTTLSVDGGQVTVEDGERTGVLTLKAEALEAYLAARRAGDGKQRDERGREIAADLARQLKEFLNE